MNCIPFYYSARLPHHCHFLSSHKLLLSLSLYLSNANSCHRVQPTLCGHSKWTTSEPSSISIPILAFTVTSLFCIRKQKVRKVFLFSPLPSPHSPFLSPLDTLPFPPSLALPSSLTPLQDLNSTSTSPDPMVSNSLRIFCFPSLPFPSLPFPSLPFPSLLFSLLFLWQEVTKGDRKEEEGRKHQERTTCPSQNRSTLTQEMVI